MTSITRWTWLFGLLIASACSSPAPANSDAGSGKEGGPTSGGGCTYTISGAQTASGTCVPAIVNDSQGLHFGIVASDSTYAIASDLPGTAIQATSYDLSATTKTVSTFASGTSLWAAFYNDGQHANQGTVSFTITDIGQQVQGSGGTAWTNPHGTATATLTSADQFATGTITATVTF